MPANLQRLKQIKDRVAVVGVGASAQGTFPDSDAYTLSIQAFRNALDDCGLKKSDIDGLIVQGPGAGPEVTAGGVFADLLRLSAYLGARL